MPALSKVGGSTLQTKLIAGMGGTHSAGVGGTHYGAYVIGHSEPWTPKCVVIGFLEDALEAARKYPGSYVGPLPFLAHFEPPPSEPT